MAYLRIATHPRIFAAPLNPDEALGNVAALRMLLLHLRRRAGLLQKLRS